MYRVAVIVLLIVFAALQYRLWIGDGSWAQVHHLQTMRDELKTDNTEAEARNTAKQAEIDDLKSGVEATESRARSEMGMIKPGETFFLTMPDEASSDTPATGDPDR